MSKVGEIDNTEIEHKKWLINRIDLQYDVLLDLNQKWSQFYQHSFDLSIKNSKSPRTVMFTILGILLGLFFGLKEINYIDDEIFNVLLIVVGISALIIFLIIHFTIRSLNSGFGLLLVENYTIRSHLLGSKYDVIIRFSEPENDDLQSIRNYLVFTSMLNYATKINSLKNMQKQKSLLLYEVLKEDYKLIEEISKELLEMNKILDHKGEFPVEQYNLIKTVLKEIKKK